MRDTRRTRIVLALLLLTAFTFITLDARGGDGSILDRLRDVARSRCSGRSSGPRRPWSTRCPTSSTVSPRSTPTTSASPSSSRRTTSCGASCARASSTQAALRSSDKILGSPASATIEIVPAQVIAVASEAGYVRTVTVDAGSRDGITRDQTVLDGDGLVGRVDPGRRGGPRRSCCSPTRSSPSGRGSPSRRETGWPRAMDVTRSRSSSTTRRQPWPRATWW